MAEPTTSTLLTSAAVSAGAKSLAEDLLKGLSGLLRNRLRQWQVNRGMDKLNHHIQELEHVKTIWRRDTTLLLEELYHPLAVIDARNVPAVTWSLGDLGDPRLLILIGDVGSGKSMLMRALAAAEFSRRERFPLFIELRRLQNHTLLDHALEQFGSLGITLSAGDLLQSKKQIIIFLDGFDEIPHQQREQRSAEIQVICNSFPNIRIVISARPGTNIESLPAFDVRKIAPLSESDIHDYAQRISAFMRPDEPTQVPEGFPKSLPVAVRSLLQRPLLLDLYLLKIFHRGVTPQTEIEFFENIFLLLASLHDSKSKAGYQGHSRRSRLDDHQLYHVYCHVCHSMLMANKIHAPTLHVIERVAEFTKSYAPGESAQQILRDIEECTGLVFETAGEHEFIYHLQEYHAAVHVSSLPDLHKPSAYEGLLSEHKNQTMRYLRCMNERDFSRFLEAPLWSRLLDQSHRNSDPQMDGIRLFYDDLYFAIMRADGSLTVVNNGASVPRSYYHNIIGRVGIQFWNENEVRAFIRKEKILSNWDRLRSANDDHPELKLARLGDLARLGIITDACIQHYANMRMVIEIRMNELRTILGE